MIPSQSPPSKSHLIVQKCKSLGYFCQLFAIFIPWSIADSITFSISNPLGSNAIGNIISIIFISDWIGSGTLFLSRNYFFCEGENSQYYFSITQILREINIRDSRSANSAILTHLGAQNFVIQEFLQFLKAKLNQINIVIQSP